MINKFYKFRRFKQYKGKYIVDIGWALRIWRIEVRCNKQQAYREYSIIYWKHKYERVVTLNK